MSYSKSFTIIGLDELNQMFTQLPQEFNRIFTQVGNKYASIIENEANKRVPVRTGYLKSTIGKEVSTSTGIKIYANANYARAVHDGTFRMPARPFLGGPASEQFPNMINEINQNIATFLRSKGKGKSSGT